jgi:hypothetical protein
MAARMAVRMAPATATTTTAAAVDLKSAMRKEDYGRR